jgi:hypothetical protein
MRVIIITCTADLEASSGFFSPIRLDIMAVAAMLKPVAIEYTRVITDSVNPTVAVA